MKPFAVAAIFWAVSVLSSPCSAANQRIAVLAFELDDISSLPNTPQEQQRTAGFRPLLEAALQQADNAYDVVTISPERQAAANGGFGYLFHFSDLAAQLGHQDNADWVIVGQHSKPSFLYSYLKVHIVNAKTQTLAASVDIELKGSHQSVSEHAVKALAKKISAIIGK
jgi:phage tail sheath gpL-like